MITIEKLKKLVFEGDPICVTERPFVINGDTMFIPGIDANGHYADDLEISILTNRYLVLRYRTQGECGWKDGGTYKKYESLVDFVYTL